MFGLILGKIFGTKHERDVKRMGPAVAAINALEPAIQELSDTELRGKALEACLEKGLMALASGSRAIRMRPALNLTAAEADEGVDKLRRALQSLAVS